MATRFCNKCGTPLKENARFCPECGYPVPPEPQPEPQYQQTYAPQPDPQPYQQQPIGVKPKSFLVLSILATIFCCLPFGIVAIIQSAKVDNLWNAGQYNEAQTASRKARNWVIAAASIGVLVSILYAILVAIGAIAGLDY